MIAVDFYNPTIYNIFMSVNMHKTITYKCEYCGRENTKFVRKDLKYRFCNQICNGKSRINQLNNRDRSGRKNPAWKGGRKTNGAGYILIYKPNHPYHNDFKEIYVFEHRFIMEQKIGRYLKPEEIVHHLNGIKDDNRPENLELLTQGEHTKEHKLPKLGYLGFVAKKKIINCLQCNKETVMLSPATKYCNEHRRGN